MCRFSLVCGGGVCVLRDGFGVFDDYSLSDEYLSILEYFCNVLNSFDDDLNTLWDSLEELYREETLFKKNFKDFLLSEIKDCEKEEEEDFAQGRILELNKVLNYLTM